MLAAFVFFCILLLLRYGKSLIPWLLGVQLTVGSVTAVVMQFSSQVREFVYEILEYNLSTSYVFFVINYLLLLIGAVGIALWGTADAIDGPETPEEEEPSSSLFLSRLGLPSRSHHRAGRRGLR